MGHERSHNYLQAKNLKCHIITAPPSIIEKIEKFKKYNDLTLLTVKGLEDARSQNFRYNSFVAGDGFEP